MGTQAFTTVANEPSVSYIKAINVWMGGCIVIVFLSLVEFAVVHMVYASTMRKSTQMVSALRIQK